MVGVDSSFTEAEGKIDWVSMWKGWYQQMCKCVEISLSTASVYPAKYKATDFSVAGEEEISKERTYEIVLRKRKE